MNTSPRFFNSSLLFTPMADSPITNNAAAHRFEVQVDGLLSVAEYRLDPGIVTFTHTLVPPALSNRGIASKLIEAGLNMARERGLKVMPQCRFVAAYMRRHPEVQGLLAEEGRTLLNV